jgi:hypothetical protein
VNGKQFGRVVQGSRLNQFAEFDWLQGQPIDLGTKIASAIHVIQKCGGLDPLISIVGFLFLISSRISFLSL